MQKYGFTGQHLTLDKASKVHCHVDPLFFHQAAHCVICYLWARIHIVTIHVRLVRNQPDISLWKCGCSYVWYLLIHLFKWSVIAFAPVIYNEFQKAHLKDHVDTHILRITLVIVQSLWGMTNNVIIKAPYHMVLVFMGYKI